MPIDAATARGNPNIINLKEMQQSLSSKTKTKVPRSPFFKPSLTKHVTLTQTISTPKGRHTLSVKKKRILQNESGTITDLPERKSSVLGTYANLVNTIVGAGIIGVPYAMKESGLVAGLILIVVVAILTDKSLRMLIETGKHAKVQSYETLLEAAFGRSGFVFISLNMFIMSFGAMIAYLLVLKDTFPVVFGIETEDEVRKRIVLVASSLVVILPLSLQRDMADLSKTSSISVCLDLLIVLIIALSSPIQESVAANGGISRVFKESMVHGSTLFVGLGVLSFAFVCQDSSFLIAGSLRRPTKDRWAKVTGSSLKTCAALAIIIGVTGFLGFQEDTRGNILNNFSFDDLSSNRMIFGRVPVRIAIRTAKGLLGLTMFCVYPMASYVARHALVVLLFSGRQAHEGDDHTILARSDRRIVLTLALYISALLPAFYWESLGKVLAITGAVGGSCLSYLGPGVAFLGIHGEEFLSKVRQGWNTNNTLQSWMWMFPQSRYVAEANDHNLVVGKITQFLRFFTWYAFLMPLWCKVAYAGEKGFAKFEEEQDQKSPAVQRRLGKIIHSSESPRDEEEVSAISSSPHKGRMFMKASSFNGSSHLLHEHINDANEEKKALLTKPMLIPPSTKHSMSSDYGSVSSKGIELTGSEECQNSTENDSLSDDEVEEDDPQHENHWTEFVFAILFMVLGAVALFAGLISIGASQ